MKGKQKGEGKDTSLCATQRGVMICGLVLGASMDISACSNVPDSAQEPMETSATSGNQTKPRICKSAKCQPDQSLSLNYPVRLSI